MSNQLSDAVRSLERAKEKAVRRLEELDLERREVRASIKRLDSAIKSLSPAMTPQATTSTTGIQKAGLREGRREAAKNDN
jgi:prefoldin subunit 5